MPDLIVIITLLNLRYKLLGGRRVFITRERRETEELYINSEVRQVRQEQEAGREEVWPAANKEREERREAGCLCCQKAERSKQTNKHGSFHSGQSGQENCQIGCQDRITLVPQLSN